jgi:hypothetical protein
MINLDDVEDGIRELERAARLGLCGAMITEYPAEDRRYDQPEIRAVLGRGRGARPALKPAHGNAAAREDPRSRSRNTARRQQPRDQGVLSGIVDVRSDLLQRLKESTPQGLCVLSRSRRSRLSLIERSAIRLNNKRIHHLWFRETSGLVALEMTDGPPEADK